MQAFFWNYFTEKCGEGHRVYFGWHSAACQTGTCNRYLSGMAIEMVGKEIYIEEMRIEWYE
jgi:hypothetical protein